MCHNFSVLDRDDTRRGTTMHGVAWLKTAARFGVEITVLLICTTALPLFAQAPPGPSAAISHVGLQGSLDNGGFTYGADFCLNAPLTGKGGDLNMIAQPGYVLLVW